MIKREKWSTVILGLVLSFVGLFTGGTGVMLADAASLPDAGSTESGAQAGNTVSAANIPGNPDGIATETAGRQYGDPDFYLTDVDKRIVRIRPMATPIDQISRYAKSSETKSFEVKYYSVGTRPIRTKLTAPVNAQSTGASVELQVEDPAMFTLDDTIRVVGVKAVTNYKGTSYDQNKPNTPDLELCVCGRSNSTNNPIVYAVNGVVNGDNGPIWLPQIANGTTLIRMGKACGELDVQTGRFNNRPSSELQFCQNFMIQIEQSTFDKIAAKEVNWDFTDQEEDGIYDMRMAQELTYLFGDMNCIKHVTKDGMVTWFTRGIWYMPGKDLDLGHWDSTKAEAVVNEEDFVDFSKDAFVGTGIGNKRKVLLCGSNCLSALSKVSANSKTFRLKESTEIWNLKFKSWETDFGEILTIHHELFDYVGMSDYALLLDPQYLSKKVHLSWARNVLDLKKAGIRNTDAVVIQEVACLFLRYPKAHARVRLAQAA